MTSKLWIAGAGVATAVAIYLYFNPNKTCPSSEPCPAQDPCPTCETCTECQTCDTCISCPTCPDLPACPTCPDCPTLPVTPTPPSGLRDPTIGDFSFTEVVADNLPQSCEGWAMAACPGTGAYFDYDVTAINSNPVLAGRYQVTSCFTDSYLGTHGGCSYCIMVRVVVSRIPGT
jgi:hypothetical protein